MLQESRTFNLTRAGRSYLRFLTVYNTNDSAKIREFIAHNFAPELLKETPVKKMVTWCQETFKITGPMQIHKVYFSEEYYVIVIVLTADGQRYLDKMKIMAEPPHKITEYFHEVTPDE
jgi:hypothetical protein